MRRLVGVLLLTLGVLLAALGVAAIVANTYDTSRVGHVVVGLLWALPGLAAAAFGWRLLHRRPER
jgi:hypothetical protein